jgi:beta-glucanase (GH16 family)
VVDRSLGFLIRSTQEIDPSAENSTRCQVSVSGDELVVNIAARRLTVKSAVALIVALALAISPIAGVIGTLPGFIAVQAESSKWRLAFSDEFNGNSLDTAKWKTQFPWGRDRSSVGELQYYAADAFKLQDGRLRITATRNPSGSTHRYNSGLISSHESFTSTYGRVEIRCKLPRGKGLWPAFWLLPVDTSWPPEIDVFEALGHDPDTVYMNVHWSDGGEHRQMLESYAGPDFTRKYHTFRVDWTPETLTWFVDGVKRHQVTNHSPEIPMYVLANLAVGGEWPGSPNGSTRFPATFTIDYIRVYEASAIS